MMEHTDTSPEVHSAKNSVPSATSSSVILTQPTATVAPARESSNEFSAQVKAKASIVYEDLTQRVQSQDAAVITKALQYMNLSYAVLLLVTTIMGFMSGTIVVSLCVLFFSLLVVAFEVREMLPYNEHVVRNFGFLFTAGGRAGLFFYVGTLAFAVSSIGLITMLISYAFALVQGFVIWKHPEYRAQLEAAVEYQRPRQQGNV